MYSDLDLEDMKVPQLWEVALKYGIKKKRVKKEELIKLILDYQKKNKDKIIVAEKEEKNEPKNIVAASPSIKPKERKPTTLAQHIYDPLSLSPERKTKY